MLISIMYGGEDFIHENVSMIGLETYNGLKAVFHGHENFSLTIPAQNLFIYSENNHKIQPIGNAFIIKKNENISVISNHANHKYKKVKIQEKLQGVWNDEFKKYQSMWNKENWFKNNINQIKNLIK